MTWTRHHPISVVDTTAQQEAAWIRAVEEEGDWWAAGPADEPWPDDGVPDAPPDPTPNSIKATPGPAPENLAHWVRTEWWDAPIRDEVRALMSLAPGLDLIAELVAIGRQPTCPADHGDPDPAVEAFDPTPAPGSKPGWPCPCQLIVAAAWQAVTSWSEVNAAGGLVDACGLAEEVVQPDDFAKATATDPSRAELAPVLHLSPGSTSGPLKSARDLHLHPSLATLAADGTLFSSAWRVVLWETSNLSAPARRRVIEYVVDRIVTRRDQGRRPWTPGEMRKEVKRAVLRLAEQEVAEARERARAKRRVSITPDVDGMAWINALISDVDAHRIYNRLTAAAAAQAADCPAGACGPDGRTITADQRKVDLLTRLLLDHFGLSDRADGDASGSGGDDRGSDAGGSRGTGRFDGDDGRAGGGREGRSDQPGNDPEASGRSSTGPVPVATRPDISVVVSLATLLGLANDSADVPGLGPIPADIARALAADGKWRWWITDPSTGQVTATSSRTYAPSAALARLIRAREPNCRMPGCARQASGCDLDHTNPWPADPGSTPENLGPLCRGHHNLKTHHGYQLTSLTPPPEPETQQEREQGQGQGQDPWAEQTGSSPDSPTAGRWRWRFPSGLTHTDSPDPPLGGGP